MYCAFVGCLTRSLLLPSIVGLLVVTASVCLYGTLDNPLCPLYSFFVLLWFNRFCKRWKLQEAALAFHWNVHTRHSNLTPFVIHTLYQHEIHIQESNGTPISSFNHISIVVCHWII